MRIRAFDLPEPTLPVLGVVSQLVPPALGGARVLWYPTVPTQPTSLLQTTCPAPGPSKEQVPFNFMAAVTFPTPQFKSINSLVLSLLHSPMCEIILHHHDCLPRQTRGPLRERDLACIIQPARGIVKWYSGYSINDCWIQL